MTYQLLSTRKALRLGPEIARGGEGAVFTILDYEHLLAKIYFKGLDLEKQEKLRVMPSLGSAELSQISAWPNDIVEKSGTVCGFVMPRVETSFDVHKLYSPKSRAETFPEADFRFIVHVATNITRAFANIHAAGHVIGDINHGHILIGKDGRVALIDTDSFQLNSNGHIYACNVGSPLFTAPELQGKVFRGLLRQVNHDLFGLAVLIFHLLYLGRHPFSGVWLGTGEMTIERAITEHRFAYSASAQSMQMRRPPGSLQLDIFGDGIATLFENAFVQQAGSWRPFATDWLRELNSLKSSLRACEKNATHYYPRRLSECPWCNIELTGVRLFGQKLPPTTASVQDIDALWAAIQAIPRPVEDPALPSKTKWTAPIDASLPPRYARPVRKVLSLTLGVCGVASLGMPSGLVISAIVFAGAFLAWPRKSDKRTRELAAAVSSAKREWEVVLDKWRAEASVASFDKLRLDMATAKNLHADLPNERLRKLARLRSEHRQFQEKEFLDRFRIDRAKIKGVGPGRAAALASFGIETAHDVSERAILSISGFGPSLAHELLSWRQGKQRQFLYNPNQPIAPAEINRVESEILASRKHCSETLRQGQMRLRRLSREIPAARERLGPLLLVAWNALRVAEEMQARV